MPSHLDKKLASVVQQRGVPCTLGGLLILDATTYAGSVGNTVRPPGAIWIGYGMARICWHMTHTKIRCARTPARNPPVVLARPLSNDCLPPRQRFLFPTTARIA